MFSVKYVAVNQLTGIQVKTFRTLWGAKHWYKKPMTFLGQKMSKAGVFIKLCEVAQ